MLFLFSKLHIIKSIRDPKILFTKSSFKTKKIIFQTVGGKFSMKHSELSVHSQNILFLKRASSRTVLPSKSSHHPMG